jgi:hypothetical protein
VISDRDQPRSGVRETAKHDTSVFKVQTDEVITRAARERGDAVHQPWPRPRQSPGVKGARCCAAFARGLPGAAPSSFVPDSSPPPVTSLAPPALLEQISTHRSRNPRSFSRRRVHDFGQTAGVHSRTRCHLADNQARTARGESCDLGRRGLPTIGTRSQEIRSLACGQQDWNGATPRGTPPSDRGLASEDAIIALLRQREQHEREIPRSMGRRSANWRKHRKCSRIDKGPQNPGAAKSPPARIIDQMTPSTQFIISPTSREPDPSSAAII